MTTNMNEIYKPGECMKHMIVEMHPALLDAWYCADVKREVSAAGAKVVSSDAIVDPALVLWARNMPPTGTGPNPLSRWQQRCPRALYVLPAAEAAPLVAKHELAKHVISAKDMAGTTLTVVIVQAKDYFKSSGRKTQTSCSKKMTEVELEMALTDLLVSAGCDAAVVNTANELALLILQFTKALAEAPHKQAKRKLDEQAEFYMRGDNRQCIAIKDGAGWPRLWQQMMAVLPHSSLEISRAICATHQTPQALYQAVQSPNAVQELADIGVERSIAPRARARRVGPEFARRLHALFTADDGDVLLD